jgi:transglutaminase-like putative cysteine protease
MEVYLPGAGWMEFDPTNGIIGTERLIRVAVGRDPEQAMPIKGTFTGAADVSVNALVDVQVRTLAEAQPPAPAAAPPPAAQVAPAAPPLPQAPVTSNAA